MNFELYKGFQRHFDGSTSPLFNEIYLFAEGDPSFFILISTQMM